MASGRVLRTPDSAFAELPDFPFEPHYLTVTDAALGDLRVHYLDEGAGPVIVLLHGEPSWSYLYRKMIPPLVQAGFRCVAPDLVGFGRSDKPARREDYSYQGHLSWLTRTLDQLSLNNIHLFCQDWGGLLGLRLVAAQPARFASVCASNTMLPTARGPANAAFIKWRDFSQSVPVFSAGKIIAGGTARPISDAVRDAYDAPFPDESYKAGARAFPNLVPITEDIPQVLENRRAWDVLEGFDKPFLTLFGDSDPIMAGGDKVFQAKIAGCQNQPHAVIKDAAHFSQEDAGEELAQHLIPWLQGMAS